MRPPMAKTKANFYVVWQGRETGVFESWTACEQQVKGVAAKYKGFATRAEAEKALAEGADKYITPRSATKKQESTSLSLKDLSPSEMQQHGVILPALAVDAACSGNPGKMEFRGVIADTGTEVFHRGPYVGGTNNIGEFLAIVLGLAYLKKHQLPWVLYSDSKTAIAWIKQKKCKTKLERTPKTEELFQMIERAENWLRTHTYTNPILKWDTPRWGEIPADFGRKG